MLGLFVIWVGFLGILAWKTANPPQLNLAQLARARFIVRAVVEDPKTGRCRIQKQWSAGDLPEQIFVSNLKTVPVKSGHAYLLPLTTDVTGGPRHYKLVDIPQRGLPAMIYPATPDVEKQLETWLKSAPLSDHRNET